MITVIPTLTKSPLLPQPHAKQPFTLTNPISSLFPFVIASQTYSLAPPQYDLTDQAKQKLDTHRPLGADVVPCITP